MKPLEPPPELVAAINEKPHDPIALALMADWYEEQGSTLALDLRWVGRLVRSYPERRLWNTFAPWEWVLRMASLQSKWRRV